MNARRHVPTLALAFLCYLPAACIIVVDENGHLSNGYADHDGDHDHHHETVRGSGIAKTEERTVGDFDRILLEGSSNVTVKVGETKAVTVSGDDNLVSWVTTEVSGGLLKIGNRPGSYSTRTPLVVTVSVPALAALRSQGSSDVSVTGVSGEAIEITVTGSGDVEASGKIGRLDAKVSGSGDLRLAGLEGREVCAMLSGSGDIDVSAKETLVASLSGSGDVIYRGEPKLTKAVSGSGEVIKR